MSEQDQLNALFNLMSRRIRNAFMAVMKDVSDRVIISQLIRQIETQQIEAAFQTLGLSQAAMRPITAAIDVAYEQGGIFTGQTFPKYIVTPSGKAVFHFDVRNSRAENWLKTESSSLVSRITEDTRNIVRDKLTESMIKGDNPRRVALDIVGRIDPTTQRRVGGVIGLTQNQEMWVQSARRKLTQLDDSYFDMELRDKRSDGVVRRAIASGKPLPADVVDKLTTRYRDNALRHRGETVGRTEALGALAASDYEAIQQVVDLGAVADGGIEIEWDDAGDLRVRHTHTVMNGQRVKYGEPFKSPSGALLLHPHDRSLGAPASEIIDCRCRTKKVIDWFKGAT